VRLLLLADWRRLIEETLPSQREPLAHDSMLGTDPPRPRLDVRAGKHNRSDEERARREEERRGWSRHA
jgi:hypothetical protein